MRSMYGMSQDFDDLVAHATAIAPGVRLSSTSARTADTVMNLESIMKVKRIINDFDREHRKVMANVIGSGLGGLRVKTSLLATKPEPVRQHIKRRNQTQAYHRRIQKKWTKRFGTKQVPAAYRIGANAFGFEEMMVVHPDIERRMR